MPYKLEDFPIKVSEPHIEVTLPEGRHIFELVVVDTAGLRSLPDRVVINVKHEKPAPPTVAKLSPRFGLQGQKLDVTISGQNLRYTTGFAFLRKLGKPDDPIDDVIDDAIAIVPLHGTYADASITVSAVIRENASLGSRPFWLRTLGGETNSGKANQLRFRVVGKPTILALKSAKPNPGEDIEFEIHGKNLFLEGEPAADHHVEFLLAETPVKTISAEVLEEGSTVDVLRVIAKVGDSAAKAKYALRVTTPAGHTAQSTQFFEVV